MKTTRGKLVIRIRRARPEDAVAIRNLHVRSIRELTRSHYTPAQISAWSSGRKSSDYGRWVRLGLTVLVAEMDRRISGFAVASGEELHFLFVHPRRTRLGVGSALLRAVEHLARRKGGRQLVCPASLNAVSFYRRHGLASQGRGSLLFGKTRIPYVKMRKDL